MNPLWAYPVAAIAAIGYLGGTSAAVNVAGNTASTVGITAGALIGGADNLIAGFKAAKSVSEINEPDQMMRKPATTAPRPSAAR